MTRSISNNYSKIIEIFDNLSLEGIHERRMAYRPLHDYFQESTLEVGVRFCGLERDLLKTYPLRTRWRLIKNLLAYIEDPKVWENLINEIDNIRQRVEHNDSYDPKPNRLKAIRKRAPEFKDWINRVGKEYFKKSKHFTFKQAFCQLSDRYMIESEWILKKYGEAPYVTKPDYSLELKEYPYHQLTQSIEVLRDRLKTIRELKGITRSDLEKLIEIVGIIAHLNGKEEVLLSHSICPKCGGKIIETEISLGGTMEDPEPMRARDIPTFQIRR